MALYDPTPQVDAPVSPDFTVADVLAWARTKPADEAYNYCRAGECAIAQFMLETRRADANALHAFGWKCGDEYRDYSQSLLDAAQNLPRLTDDQDWTFGGFAKRLEALA